MKLYSFLAEPYLLKLSGLIFFTSLFFKREDILQKFVINKSIQLRHTDGLTFEFLYDMAKTLDNKSAVPLRKIWLILFLYNSSESSFASFNNILFLALLIA